jgi:hypothetical protein
MRRILFSLSVALLLAPAARADLLPPQHKAVKHLLRLENIKDYPDYVFYIYPRDLPRNQPGNSSVRVEDSGEASLSGNPLVRGKGAFLYAIPRKLFKDAKQPPQEEWFEKPTEGIFKSEPLVNQVRSLPKSDPRTQIVTRYRIAIKDGLKLTQVAEEKPKKEEEEASAWPRYWMIAVGAAGCAVVSGLGLLVTRRRRSGSSSAGN